MYAITSKIINIVNDKPKALTMKTNTISQCNPIFVIKSTLLFLCLAIGQFTTGQIIYSSLGETWNGSNWQNASQTLNTYSGSSLISSLTQNWATPPGAWENAQLINYTNNLDGTVNQSVMQIWNPDTSTWDNLQRSTFTYNAAKKVLTQTSEIWFGTWMNSSKTTNTYDGSGYLINSLNQTWDFIMSNWKNAAQTNYNNNPSGTVNQSVYQVWDITNVWVNNERTSYTYVGGDKVSVAISESWTGTNWLNDTKMTNTYDGSFNITNSLSQDWNAASSIWVNNVQSIFSYNISSNLTQIVSQIWSTGTSSWTNANRTTFNYTLGAEDFEAGNKIVVYPNPTSDEITIRFNAFSENTNYSITDQTGRNIKSGTLTATETKLDLSGMSEGLYFFKMNKMDKSAIRLLKK